MKIKTSAKTIMLTVAIGVVSTTAFAEPTVGELAERLERMQQEMDLLRAQIKESASKQELEDVRQDVSAVSQGQHKDSFVHVTGYADVGYTDSESSDSSFNVGTFSPIVHFQYRDLVMLESEIEFEVGDDGETETNLEYMTIDWFINDYIVLQAGKFLSPIGQFRQNLHPSWINKLPSAPPGFGHDGAAPISDLGFQIRGAVPFGGIRANYAFYIGNGPELISEFEDGEFMLEGVEAEGFGNDGDGEKVLGGRIGVLPFPGFELAVSAASGKATVTSIEDGDDIALGEDEGARDYDVLGADFSWQAGAFDLRGEYIKTKVGSDKGIGIAVSEGAEWKTWYTQVAHRLEQSRWELVLRYTDFDSASDEGDQKQWALGTNYLLANNFIGKFSYEFNDGQAGLDANDDRILLQMTYGF